MSLLQEFRRFQKNPEQETFSALLQMRTEIKQMLADFESYKNNVNNSLLSKEATIQNSLQTVLTVVSKVTKGEPGENAVPPLKGVDYFTEDEIESIATTVRSRITIPDAIPGEPGTPADEKKIVEQILSRITIPATLSKEEVTEMIEARLVFYFTGQEAGMTKEDVQKMISGLQSVFDPIQSAEKIARAVETLKGKDRLDYNALKNTPDTSSKRGPLRGGGSQGGGGTLNILTATGTIDDSNTVFTFISTPRIVVVNGASYVNGSGVTIVATTSTLDNPVGVGGSIYGIQ